MNKFVNVALMVLLVGAVSNVLAAKQPYRQLFFDDQRLFVRENLERVYSSPDLVRWTKIELSSWNPISTVPVFGAFYNDVFTCMTVMSRPDWGQRRVGITETKDWRHYTDLELCLQTDSLDPALTEGDGDCPPVQSLGAR